jgi:aspartyl-tRNA(Asn)/glutamyl-tRNA(Gln) amidotransferase subunit B
MIADLAQAVSGGSVSATAATQIAEELAGTAASGKPSAEGVMDIARRLGLVQERDEGATQKWVDEAFAANAQAVADALGDNERKAKAAPGFLRGQVMKISQGKADPKMVGELIEKKITELKSAK